MLQINPFFHTCRGVHINFPAVPHLVRHPHAHRMRPPAWPSLGLPSACPPRHQKPTTDFIAEVVCAWCCNRPRWCCVIGAAHTGQGSRRGPCGRISSSAPRVMAGRRSCRFGRALASLAHRSQARERLAGRRQLSLTRCRFNRFNRFNRVACSVVLFRLALPRTTVQRGRACPLVLDEQWGCLLPQWHTGKLGHVHVHVHLHPHV